MGYYFEAASGIHQTAGPGMVFAAPLVVQVYDDSTWVGVPGITVHFATGVAGATPDEPSAITNGEGIASVTATAGGALASATVVASVPGAYTLEDRDTFHLEVVAHYVTITQPPVIIDPVRFNMNKQGERYGTGVISTIFGSLHAAFPGPYEYDGRLYYVGRISLALENVDYTPPEPYTWQQWWQGLGGEFGDEQYAALGQLVVFMSADDGATWEPQDWANRPVFTNPANPPRPPNGVTWRWRGNRLEWSMLVLGAQIDLLPDPYLYPTAYNVDGYFDLDTNTWQAKGEWNYIETSWPNYGRGALGHAAEVLHRLRLNGASILLGADQDNCYLAEAGGLNLNVGQGRLIQYREDVTPGEASARARFEIDAVAVDEDEAAHVIFFRDTAGVSVRTYWYARVHPDLTMDAVEEITDRLPIDPATATASLGRPAFFGGSLWVPLKQGSVDLGVLRIADYGGETPDIAYEPIAPDPAYPAPSSVTSFETAEAVIVFWVGGETPADMRRIYFAYNEGAGWSDASFLCDASIIEPLEDDYGNKDYLTLGVALLSNGDFGIVSSTAFSLAGTFIGRASIYLAAHITGFTLPEEEEEPPPVVEPRYGRNDSMLLIDLDEARPQPEYD